MAYFCHHCGKSLTLPDQVGRRETCPACDADLHCCLNCRFHEPTAYNECLEPRAERVLEKDRANFCDLFSFAKDRKSLSSSPKKDEAENARAQLKALFNKK